MKVKGEVKVKAEVEWTKAIQRYLKFPGPVIPNLGLMKIRLGSGSHSTGKNGMLKQAQSRRWRD
jgi:hypothetical protein